MRLKHGLSIAAIGGVVFLGAMLLFGLGSRRPDSKSVVERDAPPSTSPITAPLSRVASPSLPGVNNGVDERVGGQQAPEDHAPDLAEMARQEREALLGRIQSPQRSSEPWTADAARLFDELKLVKLPAAAQRDASYGSLVCYPAGCVASIESTPQGLRVLIDEWLNNTHLTAWQASKHWTPPLPLPNGRVSAAFVLERPAGHRQGG